MQNVDVPQILQIMVKNNAADVFFYTGARISMKTANGFAQMGEALQPGVTDKIVRELLSDDKTKEFEATGETDFSLFSGDRPVSRQCFPAAGKPHWCCAASTPMYRASINLRCLQC